MVVLGIYDFIVVNYIGVDGSISRLFQNSSFDSPFISFVIGFLCGHIFGYMPHTKMTKKLEDNLLEKGWSNPDTRQVLTWRHNELDFPEFEAGDRVVGLVHFRADYEATVNPHICVLTAKESGWSEENAHDIYDCDLWIAEKDLTNLLRNLINDQSKFEES